MATYQSITGGVDLLRAWIGPLPKPICFVNLTLKGGLANGFLFLMLGIFVMKYLYICRWKTLRQLEDDFIANFTLLTASLIGFGFQIFKFIGPGIPSNHYVSSTLKRMWTILCTYMRLFAGNMHWFVFPKWSQRTQTVSNRGTPGICCFSDLHSSGSFDWKTQVQGWHHWSETRLGNQKSNDTKSREYYWKYLVAQYLPYQFLLFAENEQVSFTKNI